MMFSGLFSDMGKTQIYIIAVGALMLVYLVAMIFYMRHKKSQGKNWEAKNPNGSKIYVKSKSLGVKLDGIFIHSVDGGKPITFVQSTKTGFYVVPGDHVIEATYTTTRPGVLHKSVTTSYGPVKIQVEVEPRKEYTLSFDESNQQFNFEEH